MTQHRDQDLRIYPKLKDWERAVDVTIARFSPGRLRSGLERTRDYMKRSRDKGLYWLNLTYVPMTPRWWSRLLTNGSQTLVLTSSARNGLHNVGAGFAAISETRYALWSVNWWNVRSRTRQMMAVPTAKLQPRLARLFLDYYERAVPVEMSALQWLLTDLYAECKQIHWLNNLDGTIELLGTHTNGGGNYVTLWTSIDPVQLTAKVLQRSE